jgi:predicted nucleic acid-binding protein
MSTAFWDSSAIVPLCVRQSVTATAIRLYKTHSVVVWWATPVEITGALARLLRIKAIEIADWNKAKALARKVALSWSVVQPSEKLLLRAVQLVDVYDLRAADAFQLAAALEWCEGEPCGRMFLAADRRLRDSALLCGFDAQQM